MKIKVADDTLIKLWDALDHANGKSKKNTALPGDIFALAARAEDSLVKSRLPVRERVGAEVVWHSAGPPAKAYGYKMTRTRLALTRGKSAWFLTGVERVSVYPRQNELYRITISPAQRDRMIAASLHGYHVRDDAESSTTPVVEMV